MLIEVEYVILLVIIAIVATLLIRFNTRQKGQATWREIHYATARSPFIFEQRDATPEAAKSARDEAEECLAKLRKHGNQYLLPYRDNVHLWIWLADDENSRIDFDLWRLMNHKRRVEILEPYMAEKAGKAPTQTVAAETMWRLPKAIPQSSESDFNDIKQN